MPITFGTVTIVPRFHMATPHPYWPERFQDVQRQGSDRLLPPASGDDRQRVIKAHVPTSARPQLSGPQILRSLEALLR